MNVAIITARAGSKRIPDKNVMPIRGRPLITYPIRAALDAKRIDRTYVATDGDLIADIAKRLGCRIIRLPAELTTDVAQQGDSLRFAVKYVDTPRETPDGDLKNVVALLGNTVMVDGTLIDVALEILDSEPDFDSVMSVWPAEDDHPMRAFKLDAQGYLQPYDGPRAVSTNSQTYPRAYFHDQGLWAFRRRCAYILGTLSPWTWMGSRCAAIVRPWIAGRDVDEPLDVEIAEWWLDRLNRRKAACQDS